MKPYKNRPYLDLTLDKIFKAYFEDSNICRYLLNQFLPLDSNKSISSVEFLNPVITPERSKDKSNVLDLKVQLDNGESVNIEMQSIFKPHFKKRILFYLSQLYTYDLQAGVDYKYLKPAYSLIFTDYVLFKEIKGYYSSFSLRCDQNREVLFNRDLNVIVVELSKFRKEGRKLEGIIDKRELWCYLIGNSRAMSSEELDELSQKGEEMKEAVMRVRKLSASELLRIEEEAREKARRDRADEILGGILKGQEQGRIAEREDMVKKNVESWYRYQFYSDYDRTFKRSYFKTQRQNKKVKKRKRIEGDCLEREKI